MMTWILSLCTRLGAWWRDLRAEEHTGWTLDCTPASEWAEPQREDELGVWRPDGHLEPARIFDSVHGEFPVDVLWEPEYKPWPSGEYALAVAA